MYTCIYNFWEMETSTNKNCIWFFFIFLYLTAKRKGADKNVNHNMPHSEESTQRIKSKSKTTKASAIIETLTKALNGTHRTKLDEEYKVFWVNHLKLSNIFRFIIK